MCWNSTVSLNTFAFAVFTMVLTKVNNYRNLSLSTYVFLLSFACIQLVEGLTWLSINDPGWNTTLSVAAMSLILLQPAASILTIPHRSQRTKLLIAYGAFLVAVIGYMLMTTVDLRMVPAPNGHLEWKWFPLQTQAGLCFFAIWLTFFCLPTILTGSVVRIAWVVGLCAVSFYTFYHGRTFGSMWCWVANTTFAIMLLDLLFLQPCMSIIPSKITLIRTV